MRVPPTRGNTPLCPHTKAPVCISSTRSPEQGGGAYTGSLLARVSTWTSWSHISGSVNYTVCLAQASTGSTRDTVLKGGGKAKADAAKQTQVGLHVGPAALLDPAAPQGVPTQPSGHGSPPKESCVPTIFNLRQLSPRAGKGRRRTTRHLKLEVSACAPAPRRSPSSQTATTGPRTSFASGAGARGRFSQRKGRRR